MAGRMGLVYIKEKPALSQITPWQKRRATKTEWGHIKGTLGKTYNKPVCLLIFYRVDHAPGKHSGSCALAPSQEVWKKP